jgi:hypothetical protein
MKRPESVRILGKKVSIQYVPPGDILLKDSEEDPHPGVGRSDSTKQLIAVEDGQPLESEQDAVLHETMHMLEDWMGIKISEGAVTKLATGLLAVIKDNPRFVSYLKRK